MTKRQQAAFTKGRQAALDGAPVSDNPYSRAAYRQAWEDGWRRVQDEAAEDAAQPAPEVVHHVVPAQVQEQPAYYYRDLSPRPCAFCGAHYCEPPLAHRKAVVLERSTRTVARLICRVCDQRWKVPVRQR